MNGHFFGLYIEGGIYDFQFKGDGYQGKYYGAAGFTYGYSTSVSRHLALEFSLGIGYLTTEYQKYTPYEGSLVWMSSGNYTFIGPTKAKNFVGMVDNQEKRKKMKKTRYAILVLLSSLLTLVGCSRREILDDYPVTGINIRLNWEGVTDRLPEGVRIIFYPKDGQGRKIDTYLPAKGGEIKVPPGHYSAVIYNYDTEVVQIKDEGSYETIMACTGNCTGLGDSETENMVWGLG